MFRFANQEYLYLLMIIPALILLYITAWGIKKRGMRNFGNQNLMTHLMPAFSKSRQIIKFIFLLLALTSLIFALARPQYGSKLEEVKREGAQVMIALDVSNSMLARDIKPNRLDRAKRAISNLVNRMENDKIGLIVFAGDAYVQVPLTSDYTATKMFLGTISPNIVPKQGTAIGSAIKLGMRSFTQESDMTKAMIIITDGENLQGDALDAAREAEKKGVVIHTLGMGKPDGVPLPLPGRPGQYKKDQQGNVVVSKLNERTLQQIASITNGAYVRASDSETGLKALYNEIDKMERKEMETKVFSEYDDQFPVLAWIALFFLLLEIMLLDRKNHFFKKFKVFG